MEAGGQKGTAEIFMLWLLCLLCVLCAGSVSLC